MLVSIDSFFPSEDSPPKNTYDPTSGVYSTLWDTLDQVHFNFQVPSAYEAPNELTLRINDRTPEVTNKHAWQAQVSLLRDGWTDTVPVSQVALDCDPPATANTIIARLLVLTTGGQIGGDVAGDATTVQAGDIVSVVLTRVAPTVGDDDTNQIGNLGMGMSFPVSDEVFPECTGRIGAIIDEVKDMFQDKSGAPEWLSETLIRKWVNQCYQKLGRRGIFNGSVSYTTSAGVWKIPVKNLAADCLYIKKISYADGTEDVIAIQDRGTYDELIQLSESGKPEYWFQDGTDLLLGPQPTGNWNFTVTYARMPPLIDCDTYLSPETPVEFDDVYASYALYRAFLREERDGTRSDTSSSKYYEIYGNDKADLLKHYRRPGSEVMRAG